MGALWHVMTNQNRMLAKVVIQRIKDLGYRWGAGGDDYLDCFGYSMWDDGKITFSSNRGGIYGTLVSIEELFTDKCKYNPPPKPIEVQLSLEYKAVVTKEGIKVGCQDFSFEKFDELAKAVERVRNSIKVN